MITAKNTAIDGLRHQAKRIQIISDKLYPPAKINVNITISISNVNKAKSSLRNVIGVVREK